MAGTLLTGTVGASFVGTATAPINDDDVDGASIQVPVQAMLDDAAFAYGNTAKNTVARQADGDADHANEGDFKFYGQLTILDNGSDIGGFTAKTNTTISVEHGASFDLRAVSQAPDPGDLSDADHTVDSDAGVNVFLMRTSPVGNRVITLRQSTSPVPRNGDWYEFTVFHGLSAYTVSLKREGSMDYVAVIGDGTNTNPYGLSALVSTVKVQLISGVWRLVRAGGSKVFSSGDS